MRAARSTALTCLAAVAIVMTGCAARAPRPRATPLVGEGLLLVYLAPASPAARRLSFALDAMSTEGEAAVPLERKLERIDLAEATGQRLVATARVPPGSYEGLSLRVSRGLLVGSTGQPADLVAPEGPLLARGAFQVSNGVVTTVELQVAAPDQGEVFRLSPVLRLALAERPLPSLAVLVAGPDLVTQADPRTLRVGGADALPRSPGGVAVDVRRGLAYVPEVEGDTVAVLDLASGERLREIRLKPGDRPGAIALSPDGSMAVVLDRGPETASFLDTQSAEEVGRAAVGQDPRSLLVDRQGRFAYVVCRASNEITVLDLANRTAVASIGTDPAPAGVALNRAGDRLYVAHGGSAYLASWKLPDRTGADRVFVGLGASAVQVDASTDLIAIAMGEDRSIQILAPGQQVPLGRVEVPGAATRLVVDDVEHTLLALLPEASRLVSIDLATRRIRATAELPERGTDLALSRERR